MAENYASPGVYLKEVDNSQYTSDTSTCIVGMVGGARRGPVGVPTLIKTQKEMLAMFGNPVPYEYGVYSALRALENVSELYYTRVVRGGTKASAGSIGVDKILYTAVDYGETYNGIKIVQSALSSDHNTFSVQVQSKEGSQLESYDNLSTDSSSPSYVERVINGVSKYITVSIQYSGTITGKTLTLGATEDTKGAGSASYSRAGQEGVDKVSLRSLYYDSDLNGAKVIISAADSFGFFDITILKSDGVTSIESWTSLSLDPTSSRFAETVINNNSKRVVCTVNTKDDTSLVEKTLTFSGGDDGINGISTKDITGVVSGGGLQSFSNPETISIDILCAPGWSDAAVVNAGINIAETRKDCIYLVDTPFGLKPQEVINWSNGEGSYMGTAFNSSYAAIYWPWIKVSDSFTSKDTWLPPSGFISSVYAYNDSVGYPWTAPAGLNRGMIPNAIDIEMSATQGERDALYGNRNCINPIVNFISTGIVVWGQKTTQREKTALDRVNVRRLLNYLKRYIGNKTRYFVFEQNVDATWERWQTIVEPILAKAKNANGIYDYKITLDATDEDFENNRMPITIYIKPVKSAEFISLNFNIQPYSASFK